jgi:glycosyltransferase involved in cell wall biosynthesis
MVFITFIIPTIGRESLKESLYSIINQSEIDWEVIVIFDGVKKNINIMNEKIKYIEIEKTGNNNLKNFSGLVRNIGFNYVYNSEWIGFLDDDDILSLEYIAYLKEEILLNNNIDVCIFRMAYSNGAVLPSKSDKNINRNKVGISFAIRKYITDKVVFNNNPFEDYLFLKEVQQKKYIIVISSYVAYFIRTSSKKYDLYPRVYIY